MLAGVPVAVSHTQFAVLHQKRQAFHSSSSSWVPVNGKFHLGIKCPISGHLSGPHNTDKLLYPGQFWRSLPFSKAQHRFIHHRSNASHHQEVRLNFKVVEGGVNVVGIWKKITRRVFLTIPTNLGVGAEQKLIWKITPHEGPPYHTATLGIKEWIFNIH